MLKFPKIKLTKQSTLIFTAYVIYQSCVTRRDKWCHLCRDIWHCHLSPSFFPIINWKNSVQETNGFRLEMTIWSSIIFRLMQITRNPKTLDPLKIFHAQRNELLFGKKVNSSLVNDTGIDIEIKSTLRLRTRKPK